MKHKIVLISGKQGSGKTSLAYALANLCSERGMTTVLETFAGPLYQMHDKVLEVMHSYGIVTPQKDGPLLQLLGTEWGRKNYGSQIWVELLRNSIEKKMRVMGDYYAPRVFIVSDCRFKNEAEGFPEALKIRLECPEHIRRERILATPGQNWREQTDHPSEIDLDDYGCFDLALRTDMIDAAEGARHVAALL